MCCPECLTEHSHRAEIRQEETKMRCPCCKTTLVGRIYRTIFEQTFVRFVCYDTKNHSDNMTREWE